MPPGTLVDARGNRPETLRLLHECAEGYRLLGKSWADGFEEHSRQAFLEGSLRGLLWMGDRGEAFGYVVWEAESPLGGRGTIFLSPGHQQRAALEALLNRMGSEKRPGHRFISWVGEVPGIPEADCEAVFASRGLFPVIRADMRLPRDRTLPPTSSRGGPTPVPLSTSDEPRIADLLVRVYADDPWERALFATRADPREDAREGTHALLNGGVGRWLPHASFGIFQADRLAALTLANELNGGLITEVGVDPDFRRRGYARRLVAQTAGALRSSGFAEPRLVVTMRNERAVRLYESLGFEFVPGGSGRLWLDLEALGLAKPPS